MVVNHNMSAMNSSRNIGIVTGRQAAQAILAQANHQADGVLNLLG